jgi:hypothetical protein
MNHAMTTAARGASPASAERLDCPAEGLRHAAALSRLVRAVSGSGLPLPDRMSVYLTEPDAVAAEMIASAAGRCQARGVTFTLFEDERWLGIKIQDDGMVYRLIHLKGIAGREPSGRG